MPFKKYFQIEKISAIRFNGFLLCLPGGFVQQTRKSWMNGSACGAWTGFLMGPGTRHDNLAAIFPEAIIRTSSSFPILFSEENSQDTLRTLIVLTPSFIPEPEEMKSLIRFAKSGNQVFISAIYIEDTSFRNAAFETIP